MVLATKLTFSNFLKSTRLPPLETRPPSCKGGVVGGMRGPSVSTVALPQDDQLISWALIRARWVLSALT